jgi:hypothetical protein
MTPASLVQPASPPVVGTSPLPARGMRRTIVGWSNVLRQVYGEVQWLDDARASVVHAHHAAAVRRVSQMPPVIRPATQATLSPVEQQWADHISSTPMFSNAFGQQGWAISRVPVDRLAVVQPVIDALYDAVPTMEDEIVRWCLPESSTLDYHATLAPDSQPGSFHVVLTARHPNQDFDVELVEGGVGGVLLRLRPRPNYVAVIRLPHRFIVHNGHHRLVALAAAGFEEVPAVVLEAPALGPLQDRPGFLPFQQVAQVPRPPLVTDFLDPQVTIDTPGRRVGRVHDLRIVHTELQSVVCQ